MLQPHGGHGGSDGKAGRGGEGRLDNANKEFVGFFCQGNGGGRVCMFMRAWMHVYTKFDGQFVVLARPFCDQFRCRVDFCLCLCRKLEVGALLMPTEVAARVATR